MQRRRFLLLGLSILAGLLVQSARSPLAEEPVTVFAAASLTDALTGIGERYRAEGGGPLRFSFAASSTLARQIEAGAGAEIFLSANSRWMDRLEGLGLIAPESRRELLGNRLALIAPPESNPTEESADLSQLPALLPEGARMVIGDPAHVPAGIYAKKALTSLGLWSALEARLVYAADVRGALALVERGEAALGIVYATDAALLPEIKRLAVFPEASHGPIRYSLAIAAGAERKEVMAFFDHLLSPTAAETFRRYGFAPLD
jgi:molybdate transport system substrate-binding protein